MCVRSCSLPKTALLLVVALDRSSLLLAVVGGRCVALAVCWLVVINNEIATKYPAAAHHHACK
jgi:hypothetical protein